MATTEKKMKTEVKVSVVLRITVKDNYTGQATLDEIKKHAREEALQILSNQLTCSESIRLGKNIDLVDITISELNAV